MVTKGAKTGPKVGQKAKTGNKKWKELNHLELLYRIERKRQGKSY